MSAWQKKSASPWQGFEADQYSKLNSECIGQTPKAQPVATDDPLVGWFNLGRNVKPHRTCKGGRK